MRIYCSRADRQTDILMSFLMFQVRCLHCCNSLSHSYLAMRDYLCIGYRRYCFVCNDVVTWLVVLMLRFAKYLCMECSIFIVCWSCASLSIFIVVLVFFDHMTTTLTAGWGWTIPKCLPEAVNHSSAHHCLPQGVYVCMWGWCACLPASQSANLSAYPLMRTCMTSCPFCRCDCAYLVHTAGVH